MARYSTPHRRAAGPWLLLTLALVAALVVAAALWRPWEAAPAGEPGAGNEAQPADAGDDDAAADPSPSTEPRPDAEFTIIGGGDVLPHTTVINTASADAGGDGYDFVPMMEHTADYTRGADLALCNFEVPLAPPGTEPSGYPMFGAPTELPGDLVELGWDGCSTGTNHTLDRGMDGVLHTLATMDEVGLGHAGSARSEAEADSPQWYELERDGQQIKIAQLGATYGTNGIPIPADSPWAVDLIDADRLIDMATEARADGADLVVASIHCCEEYSGTPHPDQVELAQQLADSGEVDLVLGHHAHVPQPIEKLPGGPDGDGMWVAYGLGNFISNQDERCCVPQTATGLLALATVVKPDGEPAHVETVEWTAVTVDRVGDQRLYMLSDLVAGDRPDGLTLTDAQIESRYQQVLDVVGDDAAEFTEPPEPTGPEPTVLPRLANAG